MSTKIEKQRLKEQKKKDDEFKKHMKAISQQNDALPKPQINRKMERIQRDVSIENITLTVGSKILLEDAEIQFPYGRKFGLIGKNGIGKTQLLGALARDEYNGFANMQVLLVAQEMIESEQSGLDYILDSDVERRELLQKEIELEEALELVINQEECEQDQLSSELQEVQLQLENIESDKMPSKASKILLGLGFSHEMMNKSMNSLSGGWLMRLNIARALFVEPDVLFLDEPTNHLDLDAVMWLESYLQQCEHTVVVVSHDREFLNQVIQETIVYKDQKLTYYKGNYDTYEQVLEDLTKNHNKNAEKNQKEREETKLFINKFRANKILASMVQSRIKMLERMDDLEIIKDDNDQKFIFPNPDQLPPPCLTLTDGEFAYNETDKLILDAINFGIDMDGRIAIVGPNGAGKSTLLKLMTGEISLLDGIYQKHPKLRISTFTQHHMDQLDLKLTCLEQLQKTFPGEKVETYRAHLSKFGLMADIQVRQLYKCSGGQKSRVAFSMFVWNQPHIMILDEPTNHLDISGVNALIEALQGFQGGVLVVSHDQYFIQSVCDTLYLVDNQKVTRFDGDFADYKKLLQKKNGFC